jgi:hypothetical protein
VRRPRKSAPPPPGLDLGAATATVEAKAALPMQSGCVWVGGTRPDGSCPRCGKPAGASGCQWENPRIVGGRE